MLADALQELAYAIREDKPVVVLILDQEAWELLTVPGGTKRAWSLHKWGPALKEYADQEILPEVKFSVEKLDELFSYLSGINLCPCRQLEVVHVCAHCFHTATPLRTDFKGTAC